VKRAAIALALWGSAAQAHSLFEFGTRNADARVHTDSGWVNVWISKNNDLMIQPSLGTLFIGGGHYPPGTWRAVAEHLTAGLDCAITEVRPMSKMGATWIAAMKCPEGMDLLALARARHDAVIHGEPIRSAPAGDHP
jgi:hypothetical protein